MISAAQMLPGLIAAWTDYYHGNQARKLVHQIAWFCHWADADKTLEALGAPPEHGTDFNMYANKDAMLGGLEVTTVGRSIRPPANSVSSR